MQLLLVGQVDILYFKMPTKILFYFKIARSSLSDEAKVKHSGHQE